MGDPAYNALAGRDASDCRELHAAGTIRSRQAGETAGLNFGDDTGEWFRDGECDDSSFEAPGMSATDSQDHLRSDASGCRDAFAAVTVRLRDG